MEVLMIGSKKSGALGLAVLIAVSLALAGCGTPVTPPANLSTYRDYLYMVDTYSGKVFTYDPASTAASSASLAATMQNASGSIKFYQGLGYVAVGSGVGEGLYRFDPSSANPSFAKIGGSVAAQYSAFARSTKAYVSSFDYSGATSGLYSFDPSASSPALSPVVSGTSGAFLQDLVVGDDGYLYAADNGNGKVLRVDTATDALVATITATKGGTTGLARGSYKGANGIFIANTGGYDSNPPYAALPGSIDFVAYSAATGSAAAAVVSADSTGASIMPGRLVQLANGNLIATGYGHSYLVDLSGASAVATELKASGAAFGSLDLAYKDGLAYIPVCDYSAYPDYTNYLYVLDASGTQTSYSPVSVMTKTDGICNLAFYE
jgi:hypothetical protein